MGWEGKIRRKWRDRPWRNLKLAYECKELCDAEIDSANPKLSASDGYIYITLTVSPVHNILLFLDIVSSS